MKRTLLALAAVSMLGGCGLFRGSDEPDTPTIGQRIPVLAAELGVEVDETLAGVPVTVPPPVTNTAWAQPGGNAAKSVGHLTLGTDLKKAWTADIGDGSTNRRRLAAAPVVADGRVYTVDTMAVLKAFDANNGAELWTAQIGKPEGGHSFWTGEFSGNVGSLFGGGVSYDNGRLYATNGIGDTAAFDAATGEQIWSVRPGGPLRGAPTIANDNVYVVSQDNQIYALNPADGSTRWTGIGTLELAGVFGSAAPAAGQGTVVAGYSSGELIAYRYENGRVLWQDSLARTSISTAVGSLSDVDAEPVIDNGRVYAIGQGGRMVAVDITTGQRLWEINAAGIATPAVAGDWIFVITDRAELMAVARDTGRVRWMSQLQRFRDPEDEEGPIRWVGPVLAGNRLILANTEGELVSASPFDGSVQSTIDIGERVTLQPVVANNMLYILDDSGTLTAFR